MIDVSDLVQKKISKVLFLQKNLVTLKKNYIQHTTTEPEAVDIQLKSEAAEQLYSSTYCQTEEQMMAGTTKELKMVKEDIVVIRNGDNDEDKENDESDCFEKLFVCE